MIALEHTNNCTFHGWPRLNAAFAVGMDKLHGSYNVRPLPAYGRNGILISPRNYERELLGATVRMEFILYDTLLQTEKAAVQHRFTAEIARIRVLCPPVEALNEQPIPLTFRDESFLNVPETILQPEI